MQVRPSAAPARVIVVGAGVGGLSAAGLLAQAGLDVRVLDAAPGPGGKMGQVEVGGRPLDNGPTVLTMRWVFEDWFERLGTRLDAQVRLLPCPLLARHAWDRGDTLDLHADLDASVEAIAAFSDAAEARRYRAFCARAQGIYDTLEQAFLRSPRPNPLSLTARVGWRGWPGLARIAPFTRLWDALGHYFHDPRLRQLFGRYATYCGSSPFDAPATLMLVAHVEREAVWQVEGGMHQLAQALAQACRRQGVRIDHGQTVQRILRDAQGRVCAVECAQGEHIEAEVVVFNGDAAALAAGLLGPEVQGALSAAERTAGPPSLSAVTWHLEAEPRGFALSHHNVFFCPPEAEGYRREFEALAQGRLPPHPTVYLCAQDRRGTPGPQAAGPGGPERLMALVNAPAAIGRPPACDEELDRCQDLMFEQLHRAGLSLRPSAAPLVRTSPREFAQRYPGTGGALYGAASQGWQASFRRPAQRTAIPGLYLAGGSTHPGPGVPMAALSGQLAATQILEAWRSTRRCHPVAMPGGMSMR